MNYVGLFKLAYNGRAYCVVLMALGVSPKPVLLIGFAISSKFIRQPALCKCNVGGSLSN